MIPHRICVKAFVVEPASLDLSAVVPVFHRWIQSQQSDGLLIDVADYRHLSRGPGVVLIGHEADYALDLAQGRPGFLYRRKRAMPASLADALHLCISQALKACQLLEQERELSGQVRFATDELRIALVDRLHYPNTPASFEAVRPTLEAIAAETYGEGAAIQRVENDPREPLTFRLVRSRATVAAAAPRFSRLD